MPHHGGGHHGGGHGGGHHGGGHGGGHHGGGHGGGHHVIFSNLLYNSFRVEDIIDSTIP